MIVSWGPDRGRMHKGASLGPQKGKGDSVEGGPLNV